MNYLLLQLQEESSTLRRDLAPIELVDNIQIAQVNLAQKVNVLDASLQCKVDKADMQHLEVLASRLTKYTDFKDETTARLAALEHTSDAMSAKAAEHEGLLEQLQNKLLLQAQEISKLAPKSEIRILAKELEMHAKLLDEAANKAALSQVFPANLLLLSSVLMWSFR